MMQASVSRRLALGLGVVGFSGAALLLFFVAIEYRMSGFADVTAELAEHVLVPLVVLVIPLCIASLMVIRRSLAPLGVAARGIEASDASDRGFRIDSTALPSEAVPFALSVNRLLNRLDEAAARHEAFAADVAHELKTPLAVLALELHRLDHPAASRLKADVLALSRLVDQLMLLAQLDADAAAQIPKMTVPLEEVAVDVVQLMAPSAIDDGRGLELEVIDQSIIAGRREAIAAALRNLVENALRVTPAGRSVKVIVGPGPRLSVHDEGPGLAPAKLEELLARHSRADHASRDGAGLGLAIVARIVNAHGGRISSNPQARRITLEFAGAGIQVQSADKQRSET